MTKTMSPGKKAQPLCARDWEFSKVTHKTDTHFQKKITHVLWKVIFFSSLVITKLMHGGKNGTQIDLEKFRLDNSFYRWGEKVKFFSLSTWICLKAIQISLMKAFP